MGEQMEKEFVEQELGRLMEITLKMEDKLNSVVGFASNWN